MSDSALILILGDQLSPDGPALQGARPGVDEIVMAEVREEATYVPHNRHKIAMIFAAMRHFRAELEGLGFTVHYFKLADGKPSLLNAVEAVASQLRPSELRVSEPGEYRLREAMETWSRRLDCPVHILPDTRYLCSIEDFNTWADSQKQLRMEYFYRRMRQRYGILLQPDGGPEGGRWNYDRENRKGWRAAVPVPQRPERELDAITREVIAEVEAAFPDNPGDLTRFCYPVTRKQAEAQFDWFVQHALPDFGTWQDALAEESPWMFHSLVSMSINIGLLEPLAVCHRVEQAFRDGHCSLAAAEGFIRQVLGWREYIRGVYWREMPAYRDLNVLDARRPLPEWFWSGETDMRCLQQALRQTLDLGYAHHIQRLMVIGNYALLAGLDVREVCDWYLAVYVDAFEWVELPNTLGMALHADGGLMASKPYAASGKYIQRQGNHCKQCRYNPAKTTGEGACPFNALYWHFIDRHEDRWSQNARMGLVMGNWRKRPERERVAIRDWAETTLAVQLED